MGWYSTGPRLREADIDITDLLSNYCDTPLLVICEVQVRLPAASDVQMRQSCIVLVISQCAPLSWPTHWIYACSQRPWAFQQQPTMPLTKSERYRAQLFTD